MPQKAQVPLTSVALVCSLDPPIPHYSPFSPQPFLSYQASYKAPGASHWPSSLLGGWPGARKLPLSGWLLYLHWFKLFPLPIHYA